MMYNRPKILSGIKRCLECDKEFIPSTGGNKYFCSEICMHKHKRKAKAANPKEMETRTCEQCGKEYQRNPNIAISRWDAKKFCSPKCKNANKRAVDAQKDVPAWLQAIMAGNEKDAQRPAITVEGQMISPGAFADMIKGSPTLSNGSFPNVQRGEYECSKGLVFFRSLWEANYALYLDFLMKNGDILNWSYEPVVFIFEKIKFGTRSYKPDFKIFNSDGTVEYHEVKGYMTKKSLTQLKRMSNYYPEVKVVVIDRKYYADMVKKFKKVLNLYE